MFNDLRVARKYQANIEGRPDLPELSPELLAIAKSKARASHDAWKSAKMAQGYIYGPEVQDDPNAGQLTNPNILSWEALGEDVKKSNVDNVVSVLQLMQSELGVTFVRLDTIVSILAEAIHDEWSKAKFKDGWVWGPKTDKANKIHRDLVPFSVLMTDPELVADCEYDIATARSFISELILQGNYLPILQPK